MATIETAILAEAAKRGPDKSTCPSEIARLLFAADWRKHMGAVRDAALHLYHQGKIVITQKGEAINTKSFKGPIRIKSR